MKFTYKTIKFLSFLSILLYLSCSKNNSNSNVTPTSEGTMLPTVVTCPDNNPQSLQKINLGKLLFFDPILSGNKDVACASCHQPNLAYTDNLDIAIGVNGIGLGAARNFAASGVRLFTKRNTPTIVNTAFNGLVNVNTIYDPLTAPMFFDNRKQSLETQSLEPIKALEEMRGSVFTADNALDSVVSRLKNIPEYKTLFQSVFTNPTDSDPVNAVNIGKAIAAFERTIVAGNSLYDKYVNGDANALSSTQKAGLAAFINTGCIKCHTGPMFSDYELHVLSVPDNPKISTDFGGNNNYAFRTPSLRNLSLTAPYMHSGAFNTLEQVMKFYDDVGQGRSQNAHVARSQLDSKLQGLKDDQRDLIIAFLRTLDDSSFNKNAPVTVPSKLKVGGN